MTSRTDYRIGRFAWCSRDADAALKLSFRGEFDIEAVRVSASALKSALSGEHELIVLDLGDVGFIDSSGLGLLLSLRRIVNERGGRLVVSRLSLPVKQVIDAVRLNDWFDPVADLPVGDLECPVCHEHLSANGQTCAWCGSAI